MRRYVRAVFLPFLLVGSTRCSNPTEPGPTRDFDPSRWPHRLSPMGVRIHGTTRILVVPARFADGQPAPLAAAAIQDQLFGGSRGGPVAEVFSLASGGSFTLRGQVTDWVDTPVTREGPPVPGEVTESRFFDYLYYALRGADPQVDFGLFDNDGPDGIPNSGDDDGAVDGGVVILDSDRTYYCAAGGEGGHPHSRLDWKVNGQRFHTTDPAHQGGTIAITAYAAMPATGCSDSRVASTTLTHELGHLLFGVPDLYRSQLNTFPRPWEGRRWIVGCWDLMAAGSWGCGSGQPPVAQVAAGLGAWIRDSIGWLEPVVAPPDLDATYELLAPAFGGTALKIPIRPDEYLLLEYRERTTGDEILPADGVLIYHVAESLPVNPTALDVPNRVRLIEADDDSALDRMELDGGNRGTPGDAFGVTRTAFRFGEHSGAVALDGTPLPFEITDISIDAARHLARVRVAPRPTALTALR